VSESDFVFSPPEPDDEGESVTTVTSDARPARSSRKFPIRIILIAAIVLALLCGGAILLLRGPLGGLLGRGAVAEATPIPTPVPEAEATALPTEEPVEPTLRPSPTSLVEATALGGEEEELTETPAATSEEPAEEPTEEEEPGAEPTEEPGMEETPTPAAECPITHVVESGETLSSIAREYGVTWQQIATTNGIDDPDRIKPGQELTIPCAEEGEGEGQERVHVVQRGETLYRIAQQYGVDWQKLAKYNDLTDPTRIYPGDVIRIPPSE
jgi:LysM repeat protein